MRVIGNPSATSFPPVPFSINKLADVIMTTEARIMNIEPTQLEKAVVLKVTGRMDAENAHEFEQACDHWIKLGSLHLIAELNGLQYVSSMGLRSFLAVAQRLQAKSGSLALCGLQGLPRQVFEMTKLIGLFPVYESAAQAAAKL
jgi:anti-anti-sigma factor